MELQWYPGHMTKARRAMQEDIKLIDVILELVDARIPLSSKNPDLDVLANGKSRVIVFNKIDLADASCTSEWVKYYEERGFFTVQVDSKTGKGIRDITSVVEKACQEKIERNRKRGILNRPMRAMVVGIPNVGKSTFINRLCGKASTKTGNKPGVTKGKQWIRMKGQIELLDTPGVLWPKFSDQELAKRLAYIGSIRDEIFSLYQLSIEMIKFLLQYYPSCIHEFYQIEKETDPELVMESIAKKRGFLLTGARLDVDRTVQCLMDDFRNGRLGRITLDQIDMVRK